MENKWQIKKLDNERTFKLTPCKCEIKLGINYYFF